MKRLLLMILVMVFCETLAHAGTFYLKNGGTIETNYTWREDAERMGYFCDEGKCYVRWDEIDNSRNKVISNKPADDSHKHEPSKNNQSQPYNYSKSDNYTTIKKPTNVNAEVNFVATATKLYIELLSFKDNSNFHKYGFSKSSYKNWFEACQKLSNNKSLNLILVKKKGFVVGDICMLAEEYMISKGKETDYSKSIRPILDSGFGIK